MPAAHLLALRSYRLAAALLGRRYRGVSVAGPDWLDPQAIHSLWLALPASGAPVLSVGLHDGVPRAALPGACRLADLFGPDCASNEALPVRAIPAPHAVAQGLPPALRPDSHPAQQGTATCLLVDRASAQSYLLTCGHVAAPNLSAASGQTVLIDMPMDDCVARLRFWQPSHADAALRTPLDAALLAISEEQRRELRAADGLTAAALGDAPRRDQAITVRCTGQPLDGRLKVYWSGAVDVPGLTPGVADYFLDDAIGYRASVPTRGGDSGAAIWDAQERLLGLHIASLPYAGIDDANAVYGPIQPVLDFFKVAPLLRLGLPAAAAAPGPTATRGATPSLGALSELDIIACTIWGEARNQGERGMEAVACVIANRARSRYRKNKNAAAVCLDRWQFSCWNAADPNLPQLRRISASGDAQYVIAKRLAALVLADTMGDITERARHYYASTLRQPPYWARGKQPCKVIGGHRFFNDID